MPAISRKRTLEFINKKRARRGEPLIEPLYTIEDAEQVKPLLQVRDYNQEFEPIPGVTVHLVDAGHILGSAAIVMDVRENGANSGSGSPAISAGPTCPCCVTR